MLEAIVILAVFGFGVFALAFIGALGVMSALRFHDRG